jgi:putative spermidine/putrescine transport system permease protein
MKKDYLLKSYIFLICSIMWIPLLMIIISSFTKGNVITFPPELFSLQWWVEFFTSHSYQTSTLLSIQISALATPLSLIIALLSSIALVRYRFKGRAFLSTFFNMPYTVPQVIYAIGALFFFSALVEINMYHFVICYVIITLPNNIRMLSSNLQGIDPDLEKCAKILGANEITAFYKITLPQIKPGLVGSFFLTFISTFNNTIIAIFLGSPKVWTLPARIFEEVQYYSFPSLVAAASFTMVISVTLMIIIHKYVGISSLYK